MSMVGAVDAAEPRREGVDLPSPGGNGGVMIGAGLVRLFRVLSRPFPAADGKEPVAYRAWKWTLQQRSRLGWESDLFERVAETDWDLLILLDACRYDVLDEVATEVVVQRATSPASATPSFLDLAREAGVFDGTVYVSANPQTEDRRLGEDVTHVPLYRDRWDPTLSTVRPETVYGEVRDRVGGDPVVAHTVQPHFPHVCEVAGETIPVPHGLHPARFEDGLDPSKKLQNLLADGDVSLSRARRSYRASVAFAWNRAKTVAGELAAEGYTVAITADHGELFGDRGLVGHPSRVNVRPLVTVPWVVFEPTETADVDDSVEQRLTALGYAGQ